ncbi:MAG: type 4a pilus biogenesis protein PilO [Candidatus Paceibacterota bacterium]
MRASTKRILSILLSGLFLIGLILVATVLIKPAFEEANTQKSILYSKQQILNNQTNAVTQIKGLVQKFQEFSQLQSTVNLAIPTNEDTTRILNQLDAISRASGASLDRVEIFPLVFRSTSNELTRRLGALEIDMGISGSYAEIKNFMEFLETNVRVFNVEEMLVEPFQIDENTQEFEVLLIVETYFQEN